MTAESRRRERGRVACCRHWELRVAGGEQGAGRETEQMTRMYRMMKIADGGSESVCVSESESESESES